MATVTPMRFFFQAEDGIRDWSVTGVQTCALPIFVAEPDLDLVAVGRRAGDRAFGVAGADRVLEQVGARVLPLRRLPGGLLDRRAERGEIGRASCRERGRSAVAEWCSRGRRQGTRA